MTNRVSYAPQDFQRMCKQAERDHEAKKLVILMERVKRQIAERENAGQEDSGAGIDAPKRPATVTNSESGFLRMPSRSVPFER